jgi:hypothetical protein
MTGIQLTIRTDLIIKAHTIPGIQTKQNTAPKQYNAFIVKPRSGGVLTVIDSEIIGDYAEFSIDNYDYILLFNKTQVSYYLMTKNPSSQIPESVITKISNLIQTYCQDCYKPGPFIDESTAGNKQYVLASQLKQDRVLYHVYADPIVFTKAKDDIYNINMQLGKICPDFRIVLDYVYMLSGDLNLYNNDNFTRLTLCLYHNKGCVASIQLYILNGVVNFDSFTNPGYERNKYNSLLTCIMLMIGPKLEYSGMPVTEIYAEVINKDLARVLLLTFQAQLIKTKNRYVSLLEFINDPDSPLTSELINKYYTSKTVKVKYAYVVFKLVPDYLESITGIYNGILDYYRENHGCVKQVVPDPAITHPATITKHKPKVTNADPAITHPAILAPVSIVNTPIPTEANEGIQADSPGITLLDPAKIQFIDLNVKKMKTK